MPVECRTVPLPAPPRRTWEWECPSSPACVTAGLEHEAHKCPCQVTARRTRRNRERVSAGLSTVEMLGTQYVAG